MRILSICFILVFFNHEFLKCFKHGHLVIFCLFKKNETHGERHYSSIHFLKEDIAFFQCIIKVCSREKLFLEALIQKPRFLTTARAVSKNVRTDIVLGARLQGNCVSTFRAMKVTLTGSAEQQYIVIHPQYQVVNLQ